MGSCVGAQSTQTKNTGIATMPTACVCVVQMSLLTHSLFVHCSAFTDSAFFSPSTPLTSLSFFLFSFILSLPCSASPKTHCLLATKAFSSKNKWKSHDRRQNMIQLQKLAKRVQSLGTDPELQCEGVICLGLADQQRPLATASDLLSRSIYNGKDMLPCLVSTGGAGFHHHPNQFEAKISLTFVVFLLKLFRGSTH